MRAPREPLTTRPQVEREAFEAARGSLSREEQELRDVERALEEALVAEHAQARAAREP